MDESLDFIRRDQLAFGSRDKPKRGLVDEPGSYGGKNVMMKIIDYLSKLPEGSVVESIEALAAKLKVSDSPVRRAMKKLGIKSRYEVDKAEGSMFKIENEDDEYDARE